MSARPVDLVRALLDAGAIVPADIVDRDFLAVTSDRDRFVIRQVSIDGVMRCFAKQARSEDARRNLTAEAAALTWLRDHDLHALAPALYAMDRERCTLVVAAVIPTSTTSAGVGAEPRLDIEFAHRLAGALARLHRDSAGRTTGLPITPPWILGVLEHDAPWRPAVLPAVLAHVGGRPRLTSMLAVARAGWTPACLVHGDLKWEHCLATEDGAVCLVDWELAHVGDPAWDVGTIVQEYVLASAAGRPGVELGVTPIIPHDAVSFVRRYLQAGTPEVGDPGFAERTARYAGARLVQAALEIATNTDPGNPEVRRAIRLAESVWSGHRGFRARVAGAG